MSIQSIFFTIQKRYNRRSFLRRTAAAGSVIFAALLGKGRNAYANSVRRSELTDSATRPADNTYFGVIGDYGREDRNVSRIAAMIRSWDPDFITTVGDNIYSYETVATIDDCVGQYFTRFLSPYNGEYGEDNGVNRFYPIIGNHDWGAIEINEDGACCGPYFDFFAQQESYYTFQQGPVRFFMLDSEDSEPDGNTALSTQAMWLRDQLALSDATWNLVYLHRPPYSSGITHGSHLHLQWPFQEWGAHFVLSGHNHNYERIERDGIVYLVNGLGGTSRHGFTNPRVEGSRASYVDHFGGMLVAANAESITFQFLNRDEVLIDEYTMLATDLPAPTDPNGNSEDGSITFTQRLGSSANNAVERRSVGELVPSDHLLEFGIAGTDEYVSGVRFEDVLIPPNATIVDAYVEFTASERSVDAASARIVGEKSCYPFEYAEENSVITQRRASSAQVEWTEIEPWAKVGAPYRTPNLAEIVQEIIEQPTWQSGYAMAFNLSGQGKRSAVAFGLQPAVAPRLHIRYTVPLLSDSQFVSTAEGENKIFLPSIMTDSCSIPE